MEAKLARASHRHRQLAIHHVERQRSAAIRLQPTSLTGLPQHHLQHGLAQREDKIGAIRQRRMKAADSVPDRHLVPPKQGALGTARKDGDQVEQALTASVGSLETSPTGSEGWRPVVSLEEVMVEKKPSRKRIESFELVCPPTSRVVALPDEPASFPGPVIQEEDDGWERIGFDGEPDHESPVLAATMTTTRSWVGVVLGTAETTS
ncbi:hypothetical protein CROQUDRAFT_651268 [Cronartium quercuum f. sp. fusiforme G11]|uniref:Uncharacterized protein n=1 Tax=Cronartium quercuum f. sp. fusiforme G11 TaxID=708437 RepID=A0A9P6NW56_9BASI|nr:hypothetical protein CROQUDRAFT_651268 [Cronartium quercuum f. sp. fusiforme G11]